MKILTDPSELSQLCSSVRSDKKTIGFVPTMGYLHAGHISLIREARKNHDYVIVSIFVNPTQFGPNEDFEKYPRDVDADSAVCEEQGVDALFMPGVTDMYPEGEKVVTRYPKLTNKLCGKFRPGHFDGVMTVMSKLLKSVGSCSCYMGRKDAQQILLLERMVADESVNAKIVGCPTLREDDGLAMSSRNVYLDPTQRQQALSLYNSLFDFVDSMHSAPISKLCRKAQAAITDAGLTCQYFDLVDRHDFDPVYNLDPGKYVLAVAALAGPTRLIDNAYIDIAHDGSVFVDFGVLASKLEDSTTSHGGIS